MEVLPDEYRESELLIGSLTRLLRDREEMRVRHAEPVRFASSDRFRDRVMKRQARGRQKMRENEAWLNRVWPIHARALEKVEAAMARSYFTAAWFSKKDAERFYVFSVDELSRAVTSCQRNICAIPNDLRFGFMEPAFIRLYDRWEVVLRRYMTQLEGEVLNRRYEGRSLNRLGD